MTVRAALLATALAVPGAAHAQAYLRAGAGFEQSSHAGLRDLDCTRASALFGCGSAADGQPLTARGGFGAAATMEVGAGYRVSPYVRIEALASYRPGLDFSGRANVPNVPGRQLVKADLDSLSALAVAYWDLGVYGRARPFLGAGLGVTRNRLGAVRYPATLVEGADHSATAWMATAGVAWPLSARATLDLAYRYTDLGEVRTAAGRFAPTHASLATQGLTASVRWGF